MNDYGLMERLAFYSYRVEVWWKWAPLWFVVARRVLGAILVFALVFMCFLYAGMYTPDTSYN